jgi:hypothetical protein
MKHTVALSVLVVLSAFLGLPCSTVAATDTLVVYATPANLEEVINSDTTGAGMQAHKVYKLVSRDTTYVYQGAISVKSDIAVIGVLDPITGRPPCIQPMTLLDGSIPDYLFKLQGPYTKAVFKNLYLTGRSTDNTICTSNYNGAGAQISLEAEGIRLTVDNVLFVDFPTDDIAYSGDHCSMFVTNCKFRNAIVSAAWYSGEAVRNMYNTAITDSLVMRNNTLLCMAYSAACPVTVNPCTYFEFSHNSVIYTFKNPFWIFNVTNGKLNDNMFYAAFSGGSNKEEHFGMWDQLRSFETASIVDFDTLNMPIARWFAPADTAGSGDLSILWPAEAKRNIEVKNNVCFWPKAITDLWTAWNDTAHVDSVITPVWMNARTTGMFTDKVYWPGFVQSGNLQADPQFGPSIDQVLHPNTQSGDGFLKYFGVVRSNSTDIATYGYKLETVAGDNWIPQWPLPELVDMQYKNAALRTGGTDGKPIGDPGWFTGGYTGVADNPMSIPDQFALSQAYPNPFNPSTTIGFTLAHSGNVSLKVYDILGQIVKVVVDNVYKNKGQYQYPVTMNDFPSSVYFYTLTEGNQQLTKKMILLK